MMTRISRPARPTTLALPLAGVLACPLLSACASPTETADRIRTLAWSEDLRIGSVDEEEYAFTYLTNVSVGPDDRIYVSQWQVPEVWIFEADGTPAGRLGGGGAGPGEFGGIVSVGWVDDTLWVSDIGSAISFFDREGRYLDRIVVDAEPDDVDTGFRLGRISIDGDTLLWRAIPHEPIPLTDDAIERIISENYEANDWLHERVTGPAYAEAYLGASTPPTRFRRCPGRSSTATERSGSAGRRFRATRPAGRSTPRTASFGASWLSRRRSG